jgi:hypothetical protein
MRCGVVWCGGTGHVSYLGNQDTNTMKKSRAASGRDQRRINNGFGGN